MLSFLIRPNWHLSDIDLMDMSRKGSVKINWHLCRYGLLVIDVFSRFLWLRPFESKSSQVIAIELVCIYMEHGSPEIIQYNQGGEFKKALKLLCDRMNIKLIYSRPHHNQSQGKVARYYRALRSKMEYDLQKIGQDGVKRAKQLLTDRQLRQNRQH